MLVITSWRIVRTFAYMRIYRYFCVCVVLFQTHSNGGISGLGFKYETKQTHKRHFERSDTKPGRHPNYYVQLNECRMGEKTPTRVVQ